MRVIYSTRLIKKNCIKLCQHYLVLCSILYFHRHSRDPNTMPHYEDPPDLINLETPTHSLKPQSSVTSFTHLAQARASQKSVITKQRVEIQDSIITGKSFLPKSQSVEFLDRAGQQQRQLPKVLPLRKKQSNASTEKLANLGSPSRPVAKTRTLPRPKLSREEIVPLRSKESKRKNISDLGFEEAKKRLSCFEKSGEVFSLTESL